MSSHIFFTCTVSCPLQKIKEKEKLGLLYLPANLFFLELSILIDLTFYLVSFLFSPQYFL